jgi:hypothetical protein
MMMMGSLTRCRRPASVPEHQCCRRLHTCWACSPYSLPSPPLRWGCYVSAGLHLPHVVLRLLSAAGKGRLLALPEVSCSVEPAGSRMGDVDGAAAVRACGSGSDSMSTGAG